MRRAHRRDGAWLVLPRSVVLGARATGIGVVRLVGLVGLVSLAFWGCLAVGGAAAAGAAEVEAKAGPGAGPVPATATEAATAAHAPTGGAGAIRSPELREQREVEDLRRQDLAALLAYWGVPVDWREHSAEELGDWRDRITAAAALRNGYAVSFDWQTTSLAELTDLRLRAAKSAEIAARYALQIDWLRYSWAELEDLRSHVAYVIAARTGTEPALGTAKVPAKATATATATDKMAIPASLEARGPGSAAPSTPVRAASISFPTGHDPDEIMAPTFGPKSAAGPAAKSTGPFHPQDPDAILPPTFGPTASATHPSRSSIDRRAPGAPTATTTAPAAPAAPGWATTPAPSTAPSTSTATAAPKGSGKK